ncbi:DoxX family protein [Parapedobacter sp. 10938]|uniref:DoxX family protein n=1 Tax=Parapedobacter flavus TaxID=3110225 RepID=UPI002DB69247|nr:DoxX family protein [Parapedobacter sp. 10938]MEC3880287.1 DoxX family protein [Parapedobacter sp. 10938]
MKGKILTVLSAIFGLLLINGGLDKFLHYMPTPEDLNPELIKDYAAISEIRWLMPLIALAELIGGALLIFPKTRALGALIVFPVMVGVLLTHIFVDTSGLPIAVVIWAILLWILFDNREKYSSIIR